MQFRKQQAIYLQIGEHLCDSIVNGKWVAGEKIPSVREMAVRVEVNPNTVMRTYTDLEQKGILYNRRGIGFFVGDDAVDKILDIKREEFIKNDVPSLFKTMDLLGLKLKDLKRLHLRCHSEEAGDEGKQ
jgi:DNA-binding transcriptional regulator YhcF (GntR family)